MYTKMPCIFNGVGFSTGAGLGQKISRAVPCIASAIPVIPAVRLLLWLPDPDVPAAPGLISTVQIRVWQG